MTDLGLAASSTTAPQLLVRPSLADMESKLIREALGRNQGNILIAAQELGLSRGALYRRMQKFGD